MKVLLIGGAGSFINRLIGRFEKEGQRVFLLTGSRYRNETYREVFERYDFPYDTGELPDIFESVDPDLTLYMGAFDTNFDWSRTEDRTAARYVSDLVNILMAFSSRRHGRMICLSCEDVYEANAGGRISEDLPPDSTGRKGMALAQGEMLCESYRKSTGLDFVTLRLGGLYAIPENHRDVRDTPTRMCLDALKGERPAYRKGRLIAPLSERDAVQFIVQASLAKECEHSLYNIASDLVISEKELAARVMDAFGARKEENGPEENELKGNEPEENDRKEKKIKEKEPEEQEGTERLPGQSGILLSNKRFQSEFGMNRFADPDADLKEIASYMQAHRSEFLFQEEKKTLLQRLWEKTGEVFRAAVPFAENLILFILFFLAGDALADSRFFSRVDLYLLYVLLFAVVHGQQQAVFSSVLSMAGYIRQQSVAGGLFDVVTDYSTYVWIAQLFIVGMTVGYLRDKTIRQDEEQREDHSYMLRKVSDMQDINESNVRVKDALETQIVSQHDSVGKVYEIVSGLDRYSGDEVLFYAAQVIQKLMHTKDVAVYIHTGGPFARLFTATTKQARSLGNSIRYGEIGAMYEAFQKHEVFINRALDKNLPLMACAIYTYDGSKDTEQEEISTIVMVWGLSWERTTLSEANLLAVICALIRDAAARAARYLEAVEETLYIGDTGILNREAFRRMIRVHLEAENSGLTEATLIRVQEDGMDRKQIGEILRSTVRETDYLGELDDGGLYILLTNTDQTGAAAALGRIRGKKIRADICDFPDLAEPESKTVGLAGGIMSEQRS